MRKSSLGSLAALAGLAMAGTSTPAFAGRAKQRPQSGRRESGIAFYPRGSGRPRYPEQSTRQELRGQRRAQGGPGITLNPRTFQYEPRA